MSRDSQTAVVALGLFVTLATVVALAPVNYVARWPGTALELSGSQAGNTVIDLEGPAQYPSTGSFWAATIGQTPVDGKLGLFPAIVHRLWGDDAVLRRDDVYSSGATAEDVAQAQRASQAEAGEDAIVAALRELEQTAGSGPDSLVQAYVMVADVSSGGPSDGRLLPGDRLVMIGQQPVATVAQALREIRLERDVGTVLQVTVKRDGEEIIQSVELAKSDLNVPTMGVTWEQRYDYGAFAHIDLDLAPGAGESVGLPLALALYDRLSAGDLTNGRRVAAAGTIELIDQPPATVGQPLAAGPVAWIGTVAGLRQRVLAARQQGATLFLLSVDDCSEVVGWDPGLELVPVGSFHQAVEVLAAGESGELPHC
ncbi:MAG: PDZ domain-containing protein [Propionibacteriaceae bacterium]|nr:PDZ domain-containing protein [Propionibacteriaceae bacterium]